MKSFDFGSLLEQDTNLGKSPSVATMLNVKLKGRGDVRKKLGARLARSISCRSESIKSA